MEDIDENFEDIYNNAPCGYFSSLNDGTIVKINDTLLQYLDYTREDVVNIMRFQDLLSIGSKLYYETHYAPLLHLQKQIKEVNFNLCNRIGEKIPILINTIGVENEKGEFTLHRSTVLDITQRKKFVAELLTAKKKSESLVEELETANRELDKFTSTISHDLKSPLNNIVSLVDFLESDPLSQLSEEGVKYVQLIGKSATKLRSLVDRTLSYYKDNQSLNAASELVDLDTLIRNIISLIDTKNKIELSLQGTNARVNINKNALEQILLNLFVNAIKYNDKDQLVLQVSFSSNDDFYCFDVNDNGIGIKPEDFQKIFLPFNTLGLKDRFDEQGTGLGLSSIKKIIEQLGGTIAVSSRISEGSTFSFTLKKQHKWA